MRTRTIRRIEKRLRLEDGWALVTAIMVMGMMMAIGLAALSYVDTEQRQSGVERVTESSFNLGESVLDLQAGVLSRAWPGSAAAAYPPECTSGGGGTRCPSAAALAQITGPDFAAGSFNWSTRVRDNGATSAQHYNSTTDAQPCFGPNGAQISLGPCTWDANGDNQMWVRSRATVRGRTRTMVARVTIDRYQEQFPRAAITAGSFKIQPGTPGPLITTTDPNTGEKVPIIVRCGPLNNPVRNSAPCVDYKKDSQVAGEIQSQPSAGPALSPEALQRLRATAIAQNWYYPTCPVNPPGPLVFVESGNCGAASLPPTTPTSFGTYIQVKGSIQAGGAYYGLIYLAEVQDPDGLGVKLFLTRDFVGAIAIDNNGQFVFESGATRFRYDARALNDLVSYGASGIVKSSWRELGGG